MEIETEGSVPEWEMQLEEIKRLLKRRTKVDGRRSRRDHAPCRRRRRIDELSEKDFEIYLDQKLHMLQQFYVTEKPGKPDEEGNTEPETAKPEIDEAGKEDKENADCVSSPRLAIAPEQNGNKKMEKNLRNLKLQIPDVVESLKQVDDELETEQQMSMKGASQRSDDNNKINEITAATVVGNLHALPPKPPEPPDRGLLTAEVWPSYKLGEAFLSLVTGEGYGEEEEIDGWIGEGREVRRDGREPPRETPDSDVTVAEMVQFARDLGKRSFSLVTHDSDRFGRKRKVRANWISRELGFWTEIMGQAQYLLVTPPQLTNTRRVFQEEKGGKNGIDVFHINMRWQALHAHLPTAGHHIRIFNIPPQSCLVTFLFDDHLSPNYANKRLEKLSPTNFWLIDKDENGRSHDLQLLFIVLVGVGENYDNGSIQLTNNSFMDKPPLVHPWGLGGFIRGGWNPSGIRRDVKVNILESANTNAIKVPRTQIHQNLEVLFNLQQLIGFVGDYGGVFMSSKMLKSHSIIAFPFNDEERWLQETRGIEIKKHLPCTLEVGLFLKILRDKGSTRVLQQFIQVYDLIAKKAWVTEVGLLDTIYGGHAIPTLSQFFNNLPLPQEVISLLIDEHLIQRTGYSTISVAETHHKQWDLGENFSDSCIIETSCFKLWDPGGLCLLFTNHLEDKVNFKGGGVDTDISYEGQTGKFTKVYERRKWRKPIGGPTAKSSSAQTPESK